MEAVVAKTRKEERIRQLKEARKKQFDEDKQKEIARGEAEEQCIPHTKSRIFRGLKILGHVSNHVPCVLRYVHRRRENFIITCIGKSINTYASNQISMLSQSGALDTEISCMAGDTYHVYVGAENVIYAFRRGVEITHEYKTGHNATIQFILPFGEHLISVDEKGRLCMRDIKTEELISSIQLNLKSFKVTALMHPSTYINKILLASHQGSLQLWNVKKMKMVHMFPNWLGSSILTVVQAPALDCVALALSKRIVIHNLRYDVTIMTLTCEDQPLTIGFRTDNVETMVTGNSSGSITLWDLNNQEVLQHVVQCHSEPVTGLQCLHQEPLFFTSSPDNSVKLWIFDGPGGTFRELCNRSGHSQPPGRIRFFANSGYEITSAGRDGRLRQFHLHNESINRAWGENKIPNDVCRTRGEKASQIMDFTAPSIAKMTHHDDLAVLTADEAAITTWSSHTFKQNSNVLFPFKKRVPHPNFVATCLFLTSCGQFVVVGYDNGAVHRYNIQSGLHRIEYSRNPGKKKAHEGTVRGVAVDTYNTCVASGGADNILKIWKFGASEIYVEFTFMGGIGSLFRHRHSSLLGVILDNFEIAVVCLTSRKILRELKNVSSPVQDALFSPDSRWLTASSSDCLVRTWDLPTSNMIDIFRVESIITYMDYSPNGQILATALNDNVGILLWTNKTLFKFVSLLPIPLDFEPPMLEDETKADVLSLRDGKLEFDGYNYESPEFLDNGLVTFSKVPESKWKALMHLDIIREKNKPKQPPKRHVAPFFLPSELKLPSGDDPFGAKDAMKDPTASEKGAVTMQSKILSLNFKLSPFAYALLKTNKTPDYHDKLCKMLENMSPFQIEAEIVGLGVDAGGSLKLVEAFLIFIADAIESKKHFDTSHAVLNFFLKTHIDVLASKKRLRKARQKLQQSLASSSSFIDLVYEINGYTDMILGTAY